MASGSLRDENIRKGVKKYDIGPEINYLWDVNLNYSVS